MDIKSLSILEELDYNDISDIKELVLSSTDIAGNPTPIFFEDLKYLNNLEKLTIKKAVISLEDYSYILKLSNLKDLRFYNCSIEDLVNINNLKLNTLYLVNSYTNDLSVIGNIYSLKVLFLINHNLPTIEFLENLNLEELQISNCTIEDYSELNHLKSIKYLSIDNSNIDDLSFLMEYEHLEYLCVDEKQYENNPKIIELLLAKKVNIKKELVWNE